MIERPDYIRQLAAWRDKDVIKVITGVRRCGKSTLMELWRSHLISSGVSPSNIMHFNMELLEYEGLLDYRAFHDEVLRRCAPEGMNYVLVDEIQNIPDFQKAADSLHVRPNIDLYITGSNAFMLSGTLATLLSGRYVELHVLPLSFKEYCSAARARGNDASASRLWSDYIHEGSMPAVGSLGGDEMLVHDYLTGILDTIVLKDVVQRLRVSNIASLNALLKYVMDNIGNLVVAKRISDAMTSAGNRIASATVAEYLGGLCAGYVLYSVDRFDVRGSRILKQEKKLYAVDMGMRRIACSNSVRDAGRILENVVFLELLRREKEVFIGSGPSGEIDFVTNGPEGRKYYQVAQTVENPETLRRELSSFYSVRDNYPKTLITMDDVRPKSHDGINQVYALDWFLGN